MEPKELEKIIKIAKKHGAKSLEVNGVKLEFAITAALSDAEESRRMAVNHQQAGASPVGQPISFEPSEPEPSESELLMWSSPYFDVMQADQKAALEPERVPS